MALPDGYAAIPGRSSDKALKLLAAADAVGVDQTLVRAYPFHDEYHVPQAVADYYLEHEGEDLTEDEIADVRAPRPFVPLIENLSTEDTANSDGTSGSDGTHADSEAGEHREADGNDDEKAENPKPAKSASKGDWLDYALSIEEGKFEPSEEAPEFDREAERKRLDDELTKEQLVTTYGA